MQDYADVAPVTVPLLTRRVPANESKLAMASKPKAKVLSDPERLGKYLIEGVLGEGGMGVVYKGYDQQLARYVAIKTIRRSLLKGRAGQELKRRFSREAQAEGSLVHPNIVGVYEFQEDDDGMPFFVMEFVDGKTLKDYLSRGMHFNLEMSLHIIDQLLSALAYSHKRGVIHRDIKPANILWMEDDAIKIADFGIAKMEESEFTKTGQVMGTPQYFSPEQALGLKTDARSDLYTTALVFYELLSGVKPFAGKSIKEVNGLEDSHLAKLDIRDAETLGLFKAAMNKALAKDPNNRFQSAEEFAAALQPLVAKAKTPAPVVVTSIWRRGIWLWLAAALGTVVVALAFYLSEPRRATNENPVVVKRDAPEYSISKVELTPVQQKKLAVLLRGGRLHSMMGKLILPETGNAFQSYQLALKLDPNNADARQGLAAIEEKLVAQAQLLLDDNALDDAKVLLSLAVKHFPGNRELRQLLRKVERQAG